MNVTSTPSSTTPVAPSSPPSAAQGATEVAEVTRTTPLGGPDAPSLQALATAPRFSTPALGGQARPADVAAAVAALNTVLDGFGSMLLAQQQLRDEGVARGTAAAAAGERTAETALERQQEAMEATQRAQRRANRLLGGAPRWVKKLVAGIITAAGAVAGAFTGGVAAGLAIAGAVLILAGDAVSKVLEKAGVDPEKAGWVGFALKIVGTALSLGTGAAGGAASSATAVTEAINLASRVINVASTVAELGTGVAASVFTYMADEASAESNEAGLVLDLARDGQEDAVTVLEEAHQTYQRVLERMQSWLTTQETTTRALAAHLSP